ncbi:MULTISPECIES: outer membrane protein [unclassified Phenylobacterium]|uniref:outer membrane protein n=1 Tax=unclassified Phenylobacterium TaxID=2640670 RepID=UPI00083A76B6|nr:MULTISPECIES: outer membrane beta-barrel protein [unclassified Phenylobacterium]
MKSLTLAAVAAATTFAAGAASAQDANWYVQGNAGASFESRLDATPDRKGDTGWAVSGAVGREFANNLRAEAEIAYLSADNKGATPGKTSTVGGFLNGYYDFNRGGAWQPFVGAGVGLAQVKSRGEDDTGFAYQLKAGVAHPFSDRLTGEIAYRYLAVTDVKAGAGPTRFDGDYHTNAVTVGFRYKLGL